jgi:hypothetical protein
VSQARTPLTTEFSRKWHRTACQTHFHWHSQHAWLCFKNNTRVSNSVRADKHLFMEVTKKCAMPLGSYQCLTRVWLNTITVFYVDFNVVLWPLLNLIQLKHARFKENTVCLFLHGQINIFCERYNKFILDNFCSRRAQILTTFSKAIRNTCKVLSTQLFLIL